jgi:hypothetical protein
LVRQFRNHDQRLKAYKTIILTTAGFETFMASVQKTAFCVLCRIFWWYTNVSEAYASSLFQFEVR